MQKRWEAPKDSNDSILSFGNLGRPAWNTKKLRPLSILKLWELPNLERPQSFRDPRLKKIEASQHFGTLGASKHWEASILFRFGFKKIEASQYFGTLGPGEASIFLRFKCKNAGRPQKTLMTQSFGGLGRPALYTKRLRHLSTLGLWKLPNLDRPQSFRGSILKKIEASHHFGTVRAPKHWEASILLRSRIPKDWGLSVFCSSHSSKVLRGLNLSDLRYNLSRPPKDWVFWVFWGLAAFLLQNHKKNWGLTTLWDSGSSKTLRGPNLFEVQYSKRLRPLITLGLWELQNTERPQSCWGPGFQKIGASQCFAAPTVPKCWEASIFLICGTISQDLQKIESFESFGASQRFCFKITKKLRPHNTLGLWELQNTERPQSFRGSILKKIEASHHFGTVRAPKHWEASILLRSRIPKDWGLSVFCSSHSSKVLRGLNLSDLGYSLPRPPKDWVFWVFWGLAAFLLQNHKKIEASQHFGTLGAPKHWKASIFSIFGTPLCSATPRPDPALRLKRDKRVGQWGGGYHIYVYIYIYISSHWKPMYQVRLHEGNQESKFKRIALESTLQRTLSADLEELHMEYPS